MPAVLRLPAAGLLSIWAVWLRQWRPLALLFIVIPVLVVWAFALLVVWVPLIALAVVAVMILVMIGVVLLDAVVQIVLLAAEGDVVMVVFTLVPVLIW